MAQLRQKKDQLDQLGAAVYCLLPMDLMRAGSFKKNKAGPFTTLSDPAGRASAIYGVAKQLIVHSEWVNSPSVFVIDEKGVITYAHIGKSWNDRPSEEEIVQAVAKVAK